MLRQKPATTPGSRHRIDAVVPGLHRGKPERSLLERGKRKRQGRGFLGRVTVRHRGGGVAKRLRIIDWKRDNHGIAGKVVRIEYDPMRSANVALLYFANGDKRYILAPDDLAVGDQVMAGPQAPLRSGNALPLSQIPVGIAIHNLELRPGRGAQIVRGAGTAALIQSKDTAQVIVQLPSKEIRLLKATCYATIGQVGNTDHKNRSLGKAGRKRLMGIRPTVRGTAQHPDSHPHGGGEGRSGVGLKYPKTFTGKHAHGVRTRSRKKSTAYLVSDRRRKA